MTVRAVNLTKEQFRAENKPGSFFVTLPDANSERGFWYRCPCGCGRQGRLAVGENFKPSDGPSWNWNGSTERPTLRPSMNHVDHWHGFLTDGEWRSV